MKRQPHAKRDRWQTEPKNGEEQEKMHPVGSGFASQSGEIEVNERDADAKGSEQTEDGFADGDCHWPAASKTGIEVSSERPTGKAKQNQESHGW